jgi:peroxin-16
MVVPPLPERDPLPSDESEGPELSFEEEMGLELRPEDTDSAYGSGSDSGKGNRSQNGEWTMPRTGLTLPTLPNANDVTAFLMKKVLTAEDIKPATALLHRLQSSPALLAEILHILRPVIYALAMSRTAANSRAGKSSWQPWLLGVSIELAARQMRSTSLENGTLGAQGTRETTLEKEEWDRRGWAMGWWAFKGAFYENITKGVVERIVESRWCPGLVGGILGDYASLWEGYHFASSDM